MSCCHNHGLMCHQAASPCGSACLLLLFQEPNLACVCMLDVYVAILHWLHFVVAVFPLLQSGSQCRHPQEIDTKLAEVRKFTRPWQLDHYSYHKQALQWHQTLCTYANRLSYAHCSKNQTFLLASAWLMFMLPSSLDCIVEVHVAILKRLILRWLKFASSHGLDKLTTTHTINTHCSAWHQAWLLLQMLTGCHCSLFQEQNPLLLAELEYILPSSQDCIMEGIVSIFRRLILGWLKIFKSSHGLDNLTTTHTRNTVPVKSGLVWCTYIVCIQAVIANDKRTWDVLEPNLDTLFAFLKWNTSRSDHTMQNAQCIYNPFLTKSISNSNLVDPHALKLHRTNLLDACFLLVGALIWRYWGWITTMTCKNCGDAISLKILKWNS